jgi:hypothetical protein
MPGGKKPGKSISRKRSAALKNPKAYEALKEKGIGGKHSAAPSKEKAAKITNAGAKKGKSKKSK